MKTFNIQMLIMMAVAVMSYAASYHIPVKKQLLKEIKEEVQNVTSKVNKTRLVTKVSGEKLTCVHDFFCLAEKSLKDAEKKYNYTGVLERLTHLLDVYNHKFGGTNCHLKKDKRCELGQLLGDIKSCAEHNHV